MSAAPGLASPDRPHVLITSAARKVLLVRAFREALVRAGGGRVLGADRSEWAVALLEADGVVELPATDDPAFPDALGDACAREAIGLVVPTRDEELAVMAATRDRLAAAGTVVLVPAPDAVATCRDKVRFAAAVAAAGLDGPRILDGTDVAFPAFVKPRTGAGARRSLVVHTTAELAQARATIEAVGDEPLVQEYIDAPEYTVDVFIDRAGRPISCVPRERMVVVAGESVVSRTVRDAELVAATLRLCTEIGLTGHLTVQAFRTPGRIAFLEVNPRYGGAANLGFAAGATTPEYAIRSARGDRLEPRLDDYEVGLVMLRYAEDRFVRRAQTGDPGVGR
jgi:carbamoyl-phosphate synthase large subunit